MVTLILFLIVLFSIVLHLKIDSVGSFSLSLISILLFLISLIGEIVRPIEYGNFLAKRNAIIETTNYSRNNSSLIENSALTIKIIEFNEELAQYKYNRTIPVFGYYTDKRFLDIEPIK